MSNYIELKPTDGPTKRFLKRLWNSMYGWQL